jgi:glutaredoxin
MPNHFYTEPGCVACKDAKDFLISHGIPFEERNIQENPEYLRILTEELDSQTTPTFVFGDTILVGFDRSEYELLVGQNGKKRPTKVLRKRA